MFKRRNSGRQGTSSVGSDTISGPGSRTSNSTSSAAKNNTLKKNKASVRISSNLINSSSNHSQSAQSISNHSSRNDNNIINSNCNRHLISERSIASQTVSTRSSTASKHVRFANIEVREFERVLTNNPSCSSGAPIGLGWNFSKEKVLDLDEYELKRAPRRSQNELVLSRREREAIMMEWGAEVHDIVEAIRSNVRAKHQRRHSVYNQGRYDRWEELMQSARRRLKRTILLQKPTSQKAKELSAQVHPWLHRKEETIPENSGDEADVVVQQNHQSISDTANVTTGVHDSTTQQQSSCNNGNSTMGYVASSAGDGSARPQFEPTTIISSPQNLYSSENMIIGFSPDPRMNGAVHPQHQDIFYSDMQQDSSRRSFRRSFVSNKASAPLMEIDLCQDAVEVSSYVSYDEDAISIDSSEDPDGDGFEELVRDTRHWYVDGYDEPCVHRRITPTVISEDFYSCYGDLLNHPVVFLPPQPLQWPHQPRQVGYGIDHAQYWDYRRSSLY